MRKVAFLFLSLLCASVSAQGLFEGFHATGSVQSDLMVPEEDNTIGTGTYDSKVLNNTYAEIHVANQFLQAGTRFEFMQYPMPGYEKDFRGWGLPYLYLTGKYKGVELTVGDYYDQFGSGLIFRAWEKRSLGIDNSLRGARLVLKPAPGIIVKAIGGRQRRYWDHNGAYIFGADAEWNVDQYLPFLSEHDFRLMLGMSAIDKHETDSLSGDMPITSIRTVTDENGEPAIGVVTLRTPDEVQAVDFRANMQKGGFSLLTEYALKSQDPSFDNGYIYRHGNTLLLSSSYSQKGMSALIQAKRSEDMSFRSRRSMSGTSSMLNYTPAFSMQHTYALAALYPYATQNALGEWAFQTEWAYTIPKKTALGGRYGTALTLNFSHIRSLDKDPLADVTNIVGTEGYHAGFGWGDEVYYQDFNIQLSKKLTKDFKFNLMYMNQLYNKTVVEGEGGTIHSHIGIAEARWSINRKLALRGEAQYLHTRQDQGDWWFGLLELSAVPHWIFTVSDMYNGHVPMHDDFGTVVEGVTNPVHYYSLSAAFSAGSHRVQATYGKTRAGFNCSGGVCRYVPAGKGFTLSYNYNF